MAPAVTTALLLAIWLLSAFSLPVIVLVALLGLFGLGANPVLISLAVRFAGKAPTLGSALTVSAFNFGTAIGTWSSPAWPWTPPSGPPAPPWSARSSPP